MATARTVITGSNGDAPALGTVFDGLSFFLVQRVPARPRFIADIEANGGRVVKLESQADYIIADHARKDAPGGSYSYTLIEDAIRNGEMPDPAEHIAGRSVGEVRPVGSGAPAKKTRNKFTAEEDRILWQWVERCKAEGASIKGNDLYKKLEVLHPEHTYQAWRDHYLKKLMDRPPPGAQVTVSANPPPSPPEDTAETEEQAKSNPRHSKRKVELETHDDKPELHQEEPVDFNEEDFALLLENAGDIETLIPGTYGEAWEAWARSRETHSATAWRSFYENNVRPIYLKELDKERDAEDRHSAGRKEPAETPSKRKRGLSSSPVEPGSRSKRRRAESSGPPDPNPEQGPEELRAAEMQPRVEDEAIVDDLPIPSATSNSRNAEGAAHEETMSTDHDPQDPRSQFDGAAELPRQSEGHPVIAQSTGGNIRSDQFLTSEANRAAESQLLGRIADAASAAGDMTASDSIRTPQGEDALQDNVQTSEGNLQADVQMHDEQSADSAAQPNMGAAEPATDATKQQASDGSRPGAPEKMLETLQRINQQQSSRDDPPDAERMQRVQPDWTEAEDEVVLRGTGQNWNAKKVIDNLPAGSMRTVSAVRARRSILVEEQRDDHVLYSQNQPENAYSAWSKPEDDVVLKGMRLHWEARRIFDNLPHATNRTTTDVRNRRAILRNKYGDKLLLVNSDDESSSSGESQLNKDDQGEGEEEEDVVPLANVPAAPAITSAKMDSSAIPTSQRLTAANLAQHYKTYQPRGADLEEEDDEKDQFEYIRSLQGILGTTQGAEVLEFEKEDDVAAQDEIDDPEGGAFDGELPMSSDQEIQDVFEDGLKWPASPEQRQKQPEGLERRFETQVSYPKLPQQSQESDLQFSSQPLLSQLHQIHPPHGGEQLRVQDPSYPQEDALNEIAADEEGGLLAQGDEEGDVEDGFDEFIDLSIPEPQGGWEDEPDQQVAQDAGAAGQDQAEPIEITSSSSESSSYHGSEDGDRTLTQSHAHAVETQDILNAETQAPDLSMLLPPDIEDDMGEEEDFGEPRPRPRQQRVSSGGSGLFVSQQESEPGPESQTSTPDLDAWIATMEVRGFKTSDVIRALKCTSMDPDLAELILREEKAGMGFPKDVPGIWSEDEDRVLEGGNAIAIKALVKKHGWDGYDARREFLEEYRAE
ncbi:hypothetical protein B0A50_04318 [Lecanosticta acicola]|uniref:Telomeric repeat-binding factor 2-interacting protein 1 n=1 Tax=Lecanosticta acicola TaxID=111012 RepID=A0AAI8YXT9_9PEZI|nr:hypothetical protein B0A50_04318 [Lecanosticta acicola]